jgi:hypothetical protein
MIVVCDTVLIETGRGWVTQWEYESSVIQVREQITSEESHEDQ